MARPSSLVHSPRRYASTACICQRISEESSILNLANSPPIWVPAVRSETLRVVQLAGPEHPRTSGFLVIGVLPPEGIPSTGGGYGKGQRNPGTTFQRFRCPLPKQRQQLIPTRVDPLEGNDVPHRKKWRPVLGRLPSSDSRGRRPLARRRPIGASGCRIYIRARPVGSLLFSVFGSMHMLWQITRSECHAL